MLKGEVRHMEKKSKFYISKHTGFWAVCATVLCLAAYITILCMIQTMSGGTEPVPYGFYVARDVFLVIFTIFLTAFLTGWLVEVRTKNEIYANAILRDVFANPVFYKEFSVENKRTMLGELEKELLFDENDQIQNMYESIKKKMADVKKEGYYYTSCNYHVSCSVKDGIISKEVNRTIRLCPYDESYSVQDLLVLNWAGLKEIPDHFRLKSVVVDGKPLKKEEYTVTDVPHPIETDSFCGYSIAHMCRITGELPLSRKRDTVISVSYVTKVPLRDNIYTCRTGVPCKRFSVYVNLEDSPDYKLNAVAFGFLDAAKDSPSCLNDHEVRIEFDDWVFNKDGVTISFAKKKPDLPAAGKERPAGKEWKKQWLLRNRV